MKSIKLAKPVTDLKATSPENPGNRNIVLLVITTPTFLIPFMASAVTIALPAISQQFNMDVITLGWVTTAYILTSTCLLVPFGKLADMYGRRTLFILGAVVFMLGSLLSALSVSGAMLLVSRAIQGVGGAAVFATAIAILTAVFPPEQRGRVLGINTAAIYLGLSMGPLLGGWLTKHAGWESIFTITAGLSLLSTIGALWKLNKEPVEATREKFDFTGSAVYALALVLIMYGVSRLPESRALWLIGGGTVVTIFFIWWETRIAYPVMNIDLFRKNRGFAFSNLAALVNYSGTFAVSFLLSLYLQYARGLDAEKAGLVLISSPVMQAVFSPLFGRLSDRIEPRILSSVGMAFTALGIGLLAFITQNTSLVYIIICLALLGFGFALFSSPNTNAVMSSVERRQYGVASATLATMRQLGMMVSMGIVWAVFSVVIGRVKITPEYYPALVKSVRIAFLVSAVLCAGAIFASLARGNIHVSSKKQTNVTKT
ncbi:MAG: MFS transporter [Dehalococcoidia bacterium]|nr:MFS transporter [Dehalococcoidia bacterium]